MRVAHAFLNFVDGAPFSFVIAGFFLSFTCETAVLSYGDFGTTVFRGVARVVRRVRITYRMMVVTGPSGFDVMT